MQLSTSDAVRFGFVLDRDKNKLNPDDYEDKSSFDLSIRDVLIKNSDSGVVESRDQLEPQATAYIISEEIIRVPQGYIAYVFLKNRQSQQGLLALNTGIIDQGYYGPISTLVTNLSSKTVAIPGDFRKERHLFFRVVFQKIAVPESAPKISDYPEEERYCYEQYESFRKQDLSTFPRTFLDVDAVENKIRDGIQTQVSEFSFDRMVKSLAFLGILFSLIPLGRDLWASWQFDLFSYAENREKTSAQLLVMTDALKELKTENDGLESEVDELRSQLEKMQLILGKTDAQYYVVKPVALGDGSEDGNISVSSEILPSREEAQK